MSPHWEPHTDIRRGRHVFYHLHAHLVFVTKYRHGIFNDEILTRCETIMRPLEIVKQYIEQQNARRSPRVRAILRSDSLPT